MAPQAPAPVCRRPALHSALLGLVLLWPLAQAQAQTPSADAAPAALADTPAELDVQLSTEHSVGRYGEPTRTRITQTALTLRYRRGPWLGEVQLPWLQVRSSAGNAALPDTLGSSGSSVEQGPGDVWLKLGHELRGTEAPDGSQTTGVDLALKIKTATGSASRGLGSGATDWALQLDLQRNLGPWALFGQLGWRHTGDVPGAAPYRNPLYGELGAARTLGAGWELGALAAVRGAIGSLGPLRDATLYAGWHQGPHRAQLYVARGFSNASADLALGLSWRVRH